MLEQELSVAFSESLNEQLRKHLIRQDGQEDLAFALWTPSQGTKRLTVLVHSLILPEQGDRKVHGNVSFNPQYFKKVCRVAMQEACGIVFMHSHPGPGWQGMSQDDIIAEKNMAGAVFSLTGLPLIGLTVGSDGTWSARSWGHTKGSTYKRTWADSVRSVGVKLHVSFNDAQVPVPAFREALKRTVSVWGPVNHKHLARLRIGIVGLGSVGSVVAEALARMGVERFVLIDFDKVEEHNLDRLLGATYSDVGMLKVILADRQIRKAATAKKVKVTPVSHSIAQESGYRAALDCDVIFSCVDRPRPRYILNHIAYSHLIPVIDGGIQVRFEEGVFEGVDWQLQTVAPGKPCLQCLGAFNSADVSSEIEGLLDNPSYLAGLPADHRFKRNENVFPFSSNLASLKVLQFIALTTGIGGTSDFGVQRFRYIPGIISSYTDRSCHKGCDCKNTVGQGDRNLQVYNDN